jgi:hypothetical protein
MTVPGWSHLEFKFYSLYMASYDPDRIRYAQVAGAAGRYAQGWRWQGALPAAAGPAGSRAGPGVLHPVATVTMRALLHGVAGAITSAARMEDLCLRGRGVGHFAGPAVLVYRGDNKCQAPSCRRRK